MKRIIRGRQGFATEKRKALPQGAKEMENILLLIRKEDWNEWNELAVYSYRNSEEVFLVEDRNYHRVPDPDEAYYFYFYTYTEDKPEEREWYYVKISKGATSMKGFLRFEEAKEYIKKWLDGAIYKIKHITEEGERLLSD